MHRLRIGIVAGEPSGDYLGAGLIEGLRRLTPDIEVTGIGGARMTAAGCRNLFPMEKLSVMGLVEVIRHYRELSGLRDDLTRSFLDNRPDVFIGIDAPDFNLELECRLRANGIRTVHYVSPQVWAWREYRLRKIARAVDLMLVLFPFEQDYYRRRGIPVRHVGHPLAAQIPMRPCIEAARVRLGLAPSDTLIALLPGSRKLELQRMGPPFLQTAALLYKQNPDLRFATSLLDDSAMRQLQEIQTALALEDLPLALFKGQAHDVLEAANLALLTSGTVTLECLLYKKPMVVAYRLHWLSYHVIRALVNTRFVALPNILAGEGLVPEYLQSDCRPEKLAEALKHWLTDADAVKKLRERFFAMHSRLLPEEDDSAAMAVLQLLGVAP